MISGFACGLTNAEHGVVECADRILTRLFGYACRLLEESELLVGRFCGIGLDLQNLEKPHVVAVRLVQRVERFGGLAPGVGHLEELLDTAAAWLVRGIDSQRLAEGFERGGGVVLMNAPDFSQAGKDLDPCGGIIGKAEVGFESVGEIGEALGRCVELLEGG